MILTTRARYAIMAVIEMAKSVDNEPISLAEISERQAISLSYLEQIFSRLRKAGIVSSIKGSKGGYILSHKLERITAADIIKAVGEPIKITKCGNNKKGCMNNNKKCKTHNLWYGLEMAIYSYFQSISVADIHNEKLM